MNKTLLSLFIFLILLTCGILLFTITQSPDNFLWRYIDFNPTYGNKINTTQDNIISIYTTIIDGLSYILCSCILGLSIIVSRIKE